VAGEQPIVLIRKEKSRTATDRPRSLKRKKLYKHTRGAERKNFTANLKAGRVHEDANPR
jgi:hypothetical protein